MGMFTGYSLSAVGLQVMCFYSYRIRIFHDGRHLIAINMTYQDLPSRQKSQRLLNRMRTDQQQFQQYKQKARNINNANELLPGLNDISDAFEALPLDLIKYFTLLKEIDAKYINTVPVINRNIKNYIERLHVNENSPKDLEEMNKDTKVNKLTVIRDKIHEIIPCLEEKMHVTSVAADLMHKHLYRINSDYKLILNNNEVPESIRIGPLTHPAMIIDSSGMVDANGNLSAQSQRSESRREALAAKKANKDHYDDDEPKKRKALAINKELTPVSDVAVSTKPTNNAKKRSRKEHEEMSSRSETPSMPNILNGPNKKRNTSKPKKEERDGEHANLGPTHSTSNSNEPTYCYCNQVSFGEMVGCDGDDCKREWFHLPCIGFKNPPKGKWYCDDCLAKTKKFKRV